MYRAEQEALLSAVRHALLTIGEGLLQRLRLPHGAAGFLKLWAGKCLIYSGLGFFEDQSSVDVPSSAGGLHQMTCSGVVRILMGTK